VAQNGFFQQPAWDLPATIVGKAIYRYEIYQELSLALVALQQQSRLMDVAGFRPGVDLNLTGHGEAWRVPGSVVSGNLFAVLGVEAELARALRAGDDQPGKDNLVVLSHALWQDRFGGDAAVIGRVITLGGVDRQVVGVMPARFAFPDAAARFWIPLRLDPRNETAYWAQDFMPVIARLRAGVTLAQVQHEIQWLSPAPWRHFCTPRRPGTRSRSPV